MSDVGRWRKTFRLTRLVVLACGPLSLAGCGDSDEPADVASTSAAAAAPAGHAADAGGHGAPAEHGSTPTGDPHAASTAVVDPHGDPVPQAMSHDAGTSAGAHGSSTLESSSVDSHGAQAAQAGAAVASHDAAHGVGASSASPDASHGSSGRAASGGAGSHGGPAANPAAHGVPVTTDRSIANAAHDGTGAHGATVASGATEADGARGQAVNPNPGAGAIESEGSSPEEGHSQMVPGAGAVPEGFAGSDIPGATAPQQSFEKGTAEYAVQQLVLKMQAGNTEGMDELISSKTKDPELQPLFEGTADEERIKKNKELVAGATLASRRESGNSKVFIVNTTGGEILTFTTRRDGEVYKVVNLRIEMPRGVKARKTNGN